MVKKKSYEHHRRKLEFFELRETILSETTMMRDMNLLSQSILEVLFVDITEQCRKPDVALGRRIFAHFILEKYTMLSQERLIELAKLPIDRSTIAAGEKALQNLLDVDRQTKEAYFHVKSRWEQLQMLSSIPLISFMEEKILNSMLKTIPLLSVESLNVISSEIQSQFLKRNLRKDTEKGG